VPANSLAVSISLFRQYEMFNPVKKIAEAFKGQTYTDWVIDSAIPEGTYYIYIQSANNGYISARSPDFQIIRASFTFTTMPSRIVTSAVNGISWASRGESPNIKLELYSASSDNTLTLVAPETSGLPANGISNTGYYGWNVPVLPSGNYALRIRSASDASAVLTSNVFAPVGGLVNSVIVTPSADKGLFLYQNYTVQWTSLGAVSSVSIDIIVESTPFSILKNGAPAGSYMFMLNPTIPEGPAQLSVYPTSSSPSTGRIVIANGDSTSSVSVMRPSIVVIQPRSGSRLQPGAMLTVQWASPVQSNTVDVVIGVSVDGSTWDEIGRQRMTSTHITVVLPASLASNDEGYLMVWADGEYSNLRSDRLSIITSSGRPSINFGAIIGGVCGGAACISFVGIAIFYLVRHSKSEKEIEPQPSMEVPKRRRSAMRLVSTDALDIAEIPPLTPKAAHAMRGGPMPFRMPPPPAVSLPSTPSSRRSSFTAEVRPEVRTEVRNEAPVTEMPGTPTGEQPNRPGVRQRSFVRAA